MAVRADLDLYNVRLGFGRLRERVAAMCGDSPPARGEARMRRPVPGYRLGR